MKDYGFTKREIYDYCTNAADKSLAIKIEVKSKECEFFNTIIKGTRLLIGHVKQAHGFVSFEMYRGFMNSINEESKALYVLNRKKAK